MFCVYSKRKRCSLPDCTQIFIFYFCLFVYLFIYLFELLKKIELIRVVSCVKRAIWLEFLTNRFLKKTCTVAIFKEASGLHQF